MISNITNHGTHTRPWTWQNVSKWFFREIGMNNRLSRNLDVLIHYTIVRGYVFLSVWCVRTQESSPIHLCTHWTIMYPFQMKKILRLRQCGFQCGILIFISSILLFSFVCSIERLFLPLCPSLSLRIHRPLSFSLLLTLARHAHSSEHAHTAYIY